ncbi:hypothetical protein C0995_005851 [Termitomyces sp. Mi166|nr:hypothetical protein C0995_005851 [Termitomyces sp. Mi166\
MSVELCSMTNHQFLINNSGSAVLGGKGAWVALDFGVEVVGLISFNINAINTTTPTTTTTTSLSLSFTESPFFIRPTASDDSSFPSANTTGGGGDDLDLECVMRDLFMPHVDDLRAYTAYFYTLDLVFDDMGFLTTGPRPFLSSRTASADDGFLGFSLVCRLICCPNKHGPGGHGTDGAVCSCWE